MKHEVRTAQPATSAQTFAEPNWVDVAKYRAVMRGLRAMQLPLVGAALIQAVLIYGHVPAAQLLAWLGFVAVVTAWRAVVIRRFAVLTRSETAETATAIATQLAFMRRQRGIWSASAAIWAMAPLWFYGHLPIDAAVLCWVLTACTGLLAMLYLSPQLSAAKSYWAVFAAGTALAAALHVWWPRHQAGLPHSWWIPLVLGGYLLMLRQVALELYELHSKIMDLRYENTTLVDSLRRQTEAAQHAAEFRSRFLAGAAHDLKQPIHALGIYAEWLSNEPDLVDELGPKILQSTQAINTLFDSLFDLARLDGDEFRNEPRALDVAALLADLHVQFRPLAVQKGLQLRVRPCAGSVMADPIVLRRILGNLVSNAIRYTSHGGVLLCARMRGHHVAFEVWDTGIGVAPEQQSRIFSEFYKVQTGGTEDGFGLGLAIVHRLAATVGYPVSLHSRLARGSMFRVLVPRALTQAAHAAAPRGGA